MLGFKIIYYLRKKKNNEINLRLFRRLQKSLSSIKNVWYVQSFYYAQLKRS